MYTFESRVRYSECDEHGDLSLLSMINYLQDCSTFHSESIDRGVAYMHEHGMAWLIAAWQIEIMQLPHFCDDIRVSTWCPTMARTTTSRNFIICDPSGKQLVRADSLWFIYDYANGRPIRIPEDQLVYLTDDAPLDMPPTQRRLPVKGTYTEAPSLTASEMHLDTNRHVNNAQYLGMATNAIAAISGPDQALRSTDITRICVQYKHQALLGDTIVPRVHESGSVRTVNLVNTEGETYAVVRIETKDESNGSR